MNLITTWYCQPFISKKNPKHLIVIVTGLGGHYKPLKPLQDSFRHHIQHNNIQDGVMVYLSRSNSNGLLLFPYRKTLQGIKTGAERLYQEINSVIQQNPSINKLSLIGCSLGGLYCRYTLKLLSNADHSDLELINFITMATPHCGVKDWVKKTQWNVCGSTVSLYDIAKVASKYIRFLCPKTWMDLLLLDKEHLLISMATNDEYLKPLRAFKNRICFGNGKHDRLVSFSSSLLLFGAKEAQIGIDLYDKMVSENNKFFVKELSEKPKYKQLTDDICWFHDLRQMNWKKMAVCWAQNVFGNKIHKQTAIACDPLFDTVIKHFMF